MQVHLSLLCISPPFLLQVQLNISPQGLHPGFLFGWLLLQFIVLHCQSILRVLKVLHFHFTIHLLQFSKIFLSHLLLVWLVRRVLKLFYFLCRSLSVAHHHSPQLFLLRKLHLQFLHSIFILVRQLLHFCQLFRHLPHCLPPLLASHEHFPHGFHQVSLVEQLSG